MARPARSKGVRKAPKRKSAPAVKSAAKKASGRSVAPSRKTAAPKRPPEVSAAKWRGYSASYRKRLAGFYRKNPGAPLYRARGKQAGESLTRRQRLEERIAALSERQSYRGGRYGARDAADIADSYRALIRDLGEGAFGTLERTIAKRQKGEGRITADELGFDWSDYDGDDSELFYN